ncbi:serine hydrolase [Flammeovirga sp. OC4]|uniref:serine hydrolase domain-containing protein n=1 Tax=Flammeovirga sp. OC4 TaxID=1382345 RepID=UPI0012E01689|nr:serine hydrolase domain-containing protein [Flammeovirga sp. OC4]
MKNQTKRFSTAKKQILKFSSVLLPISMMLNTGCTTSNAQEEHEVNVPKTEKYVSKITEITTPMSKVKEPFPLEFVQETHRNFSTANWQAGGDQSVYINMNIPEFFNVDMATPTHEVVNLERTINKDLGNITFTQGDGEETVTLDQYLADDYNRVQGIIMAHKGKVVYESYPGMNPEDYHVWMSASKTTVGTLCILLEKEGKMDLEKPITYYATELAGTAWDNVSVKNALNMATGLDLEETTAAFQDPNSWIEQYFAKAFEGEGSEWIEVMKAVQPLENEKPGERFRYSTAITEALVLASQRAAGNAFTEAFDERVWSKVGVKNPFMVGLSPDGNAGAGGLIYTTIEDALKYAMMYTPSWNVVSDEQVITPEILKRIRTLGDPAAYKGSTEEGYSVEWTGDLGERNSAQWDLLWADGAMFKHGNMHQGIYVDPERDFCAFVFSLCPNERTDHNPGYMRAVAKKLAGK